MADAPAEIFVTPMEDSRRWRNILRRPGDIVISTPPKCGTTWTQQIVSSLLWPAGDAPGGRGQLSPWIDARGEPIEALAERLAAQTHRRFLKTHSPGDCIPFDAACRYITVYRDPRDAFVSWGNHRATMRPEIVDAMNASAGSSVEPLTRSFDGDYDDLFAEWSTYCSPVRHLASWWPRRDRPNVLFVHYSDLLAEPQAEMQRIADFLDIEIASREWSAILDRCSLTSMRQTAEEHGGLDAVFVGGASSFFNQGVNGRWATTLSTEQVDRVLDLITDQLDEQAAEWLTSGSLGCHVRPEQVQGARIPSSAPRPHPIFGRIRQRPANSLDAISERRVAEARRDGLFENLPLHGKPIPDLGRQRAPGWWAEQFVAKERNKLKALQLEDHLRSAMPGLWRLGSEEEVVSRVAELNADIDAYNSVTTLRPRQQLDLKATLSTWQRLKPPRS